MKDYLGKILLIGDEVVFIESRYRNFVDGKVLKINKQKVTIEDMEGTYETCIYPNVVIKKF